MDVVLSAVGDGSVLEGEDDGLVRIGILGGSDVDGGRVGSLDGDVGGDGQALGDGDRPEDVDGLGSGIDGGLQSGVVGDGDGASGVVLGGVDDCLIVESLTNGDPILNLDQSDDIDGSLVRKFKPA